MKYPVLWRRSLKKILKATKRLGAGDYAVDMPAVKDPDLKELATVIGQLTSKLEEQHQALRAEKEHMASAIAELRKLENVRKDFVANVSHELKTPLTNICGYAETLSHGALGDREATKRFVDKIAKNAFQLQNLIQDLLELSELDSGLRDVDLENMEVGKLIREVQSDYAEKMTDKNLQFEISAAENLQVRAQKSALKQVLRNLLDNAIKYTEENGRVRMTAFGRDDLCEIIVEDTGIGIDASDIPRIFERFYRVDKARSRDMGGTGLGLAIVKHLVQAQGGSVTVVSQPNRGSRFIIILQGVTGP